ncbi:MAG: hypothetical protein FJZ95_10935 [Chloroflexi bacterium]|nr:hypothetical protein [Chloroflexota bacterium]
MAELTDYSGSFEPEFDHRRFSKETLLKLLKTYNEYMLRVDGFWYLAVMNRWGNDAAFECDAKVWEKAQPYEMKTMSNLLNIRGDDVATVMKAIQVSPWMWIYDYAIDLKNRNHAIVTYNTCPTLLALEKEGTGREELICRNLEPKMMGVIAHYFNPAITVTPLKVPPRTDYRDVCCQWEFKLEPRS